MRVIAGTAKGRRLKAPEGNGVRPTADRVKEAMFSIIQFDIEGAKALDLFAGSGALGIEALSRGAAHCVFVEAAGEASKILRENIAACGVENKSTVQKGQAEDFAPLWRGGPFDLVFLDPPYGKGLIEKMTQSLLTCQLLSDRVIIIAESDEKDDLPQAVGPIARKKAYRYGNTRVSIYGREEIG